MSRPNPLTRKPVVMHVPVGTLVTIGNEISFQIQHASRGKAEIHVFAPLDLSVDRFNTRGPISQNDDGPSAPTLEPSAKDSVIDQD
ncbi:hypothetical protein [Xanthomonas citri]|uniref:hypothetical protein n=1 Tax=Xanthomonas citri TaxID=346 RepID=UPI0010397947|nr:hypothetical protein [Xanthomonas citri]MCC8490861.1 hypothetical protein [Xanthomonas citri pv. fuscans]